MEKYVIITDSCSDLSAELRKKFDIEYVQMHITYENKELPASLDWDYYTPKELYDLMRSGVVVKTTQVPQNDYIEVYTKYIKEGYGILSISCSSALSGSYNTSCVVANMLKEDFKDAKIYCIDALNSCLGEGLMAIMASTMRSEGKSLEEVACYIEENKLKVNQVATVESLEYLKRAGRVKASSAFFGNIFGVKPIIISDTLGQNYAMEKVKGRKNSINRLIELIKENIIKPEEQTIYIGHADCIEVALEVEKIIKEEIKPLATYINYIGPIIGASTGPGTIGIYFYGKEVTITGN